MNHIDHPTCRQRDGSPARSAWILALFCLLGSGGCATKVPYTPQLDAVDRQGPPKAMEELVAVVQRVLLPRVIAESVKATEEHLVYDYVPEWHYYWYWFAIDTGPKTIAWAVLDRIDLYDNNRVFMYGAGGYELGWLHFHSREDAMTFIDLALSLAARWKAARRPG
ncbi:MAG: hypothetical protein HY720_01630 [Planctomycetes bacterium]|nr:hypothetical protein [Planctomycetota bacterium]